jgi:2-dehydro-3-deoxyphosphogluconate aldolase / (4S)-4-hydroxy-2-oxoglutarate aldolase
MSEQRARTVSALERAGVVAVIRLQDPARLRAVVDALIEGGVHALEVTMTVPRAIEAIATLAASLPDQFLLGAGTVLDGQSALRAIEAGASFVVSPVFRRDVLSACHRLETAALPGCFTPTEILDAWEAGADIVKVFPATSLGPRFVADVRAPLPQLKLMPTGGVTLENAGDWIRAGAAAVGIGSALVDPRAVETGAYEAIAANARRVIARVHEVRAGAP